MTVAETNQEQLFFVTIEQLAITQRAVAVLATSADDAGKRVLNGDGLDIGYLGGREVDSKITIVDVGDSEEQPAGLFIDQKNLVRTLKEINGR